LEDFCEQKYLVGSSFVVRVLAPLDTWRAVRFLLILHVAWQFPSHSKVWRESVAFRLPEGKRKSNDQEKTT
jgi:hypothetical protein